MKAKLKKPKLAKKPSALITQALEDLKAVEKSKQYTIDMGTYHARDEGEDKCSVCFAGAVIARAGNDPELDIEPHDFDEDVQNKLYALDNFRQGDIIDGLTSMGIKIPLILRIKSTDSWSSDYTCIEVAQYDTDPVQFKKDMKEIAKGLELLGL